MTKKLRDIFPLKVTSFVLNKDGYAVPKKPVHFKSDVPFYFTKDGHAVPKDPIHYRNRSPGRPSKLKEDATVQTHAHILDWLDKSDNEHIHKPSKVLSDYDEERNHQNAIDSHLKTLQGHITPDEEYHLFNYTKKSNDLNKSLISDHISGKKTTPTERINQLDSATNRPLKDHLHVYSGVGFHPGEMAAQSKDHIIHLPAYTSTTHSKRIAQSFARDRQGEDKHILHIHMKPGDKAVHIGDRSFFDSEHETLLPRNTKLKINPTPDVYHSNTANKYHIWHAEIAGQD